MFCDHAAMPLGTKANGYSIFRPRKLLGRKQNAGHQPNSDLPQRQFWPQLSALQVWRKI
jgi:hypothetical protein